MQKGWVEAGNLIHSVSSIQYTFMKPTSRSFSLRSRFGLLALALSALAVSSCRTTEGFGRDMQHLGNKIENSAERHL